VTDGEVWLEVEFSGARRMLWADILLDGAEPFAFDFWRAANVTALKVRTDGTIGGRVRVGPGPRRLVIDPVWIERVIIAGDL
jgi:hypothetical protein